MLIPRPPTNWSSIDKINTNNFVTSSLGGCDQWGPTRSLGWAGILIVWFSVCFLLFFATVIWYNWSNYAHIKWIEKLNVVFNTYINNTLCSKYKSNWKRSLFYGPQKHTISINIMWVLVWHNRVFLICNDYIWFETPRPILKL